MLLQRGSLSILNISTSPYPLLSGGDKIYLPLTGGDTEGVLTYFISKDILSLIF